MPQAIWWLPLFRQLKQLGLNKSYNSQSEPYISEPAIPQPAPPTPWSSPPEKEQEAGVGLDSIRKAIGTHTTERDIVYIELRYDQKFWNAQLKR